MKELENYTIEVAVKEIQKAILNELNRKEVINFYQFNESIKRLDERIYKINKNKVNNTENMIVKIKI